MHIVDICCRYDETMATGIMQNDSAEIFLKLPVADFPFYLALGMR